jgi:hydrogenase maturation protease
VSRGHWTVLGIGNPERGDDGAGRAVARRLREVLPDDVTVAEADGEAADLVARLAGAQVAFLVDACVSGAPAGTVRRIDAGREPLDPEAFAVSSHGLGPAQAVELARALGSLPPTCVVYAIEGESFDPGAPLSPAVAEAVERVAKRLRAELTETIEEAEEAARA